ncbi:MAG: YccF domain-containing protein [Lachnospiraceae bacterium]|nr:YccF domain-containing protein [Lachnospiraceae bacterium]
MSLLGNILWIICGGLVSAISWALVGIGWCISVIGIPVGIQCFKIAGLVLSPFGKDVEGGGGLGSCLLNIIWFFLGGIELALVHAVIGLILCITVVGIPFGLQFFKIAKLSLAPFGKYVA